MQIGPYTVLEEIARGGHGVVYRAQDRHGEVVALKLLLAHRAENERARKRFQAEGNALARLRHPHVVSILAAGEHEGCPWLALEYVEGESLEARLRRGPLPIHEALRVALQLAQALSHVHSCGVLHRDLKPDNVLLRGNEALLTDFGLVLDEQASVSRITATGVLQGTPGYWAPEQARGETREHGEQTDVYGLGAVLYACLTSSAPVQAGSLQEYVQTIRFSQVTSPRRLRADVPSWLSDLCMRCLAIAPGSRPGSANEVARALALAGTQEEPKAASPRRRQLVVGLAGTVGALGLVTLGWWARGAQGPRAEPVPPEDAQPTVEPFESSPPALPPPSPAVSPDRTQQGEALVEAANAKRQAGRYAEAIEDLDKAIELDPRNASRYLQRGANKALLGRHAEAIEDLDKALELDPRNSLAYFGRGSSKADLGHHAEALGDFDTALELQPRFALAYRSRGSSRAKLGRHAEAIEDYDTTLQLNPRFAQAYSGRGVSKLNLGRYAEAIEDFDQALQLDPRFAQAYSNRGASKAQLGRHAEAVEDFDKALQLDPRNSLAYGGRAVSKAQLGRHAEASEDFDKALQLDPRSSMIYNGRGVSKANLGRYAEAIEDYDKALQLDPRNVLAYTNRGMSKADLGRHVEATEDFDKAIDLAPRNAQLYGNRGSSKAQLGRYAEAIEDYDKALEHGLGASEADRVRQWREAAARLATGGG